ncbi:MAG: LapA family protein [Sphingomonadaceae bacterium]
MNFIRGLLIALLVAGLTLFAVANSQTLTLNFGFVQLDVWLPLVVLVSFLIGFLPPWLRLSADRMVLKRRLKRTEAALEDAEAGLSQARIELLRSPGRPEGGPVPEPIQPPRPVVPPVATQPPPPPGS